MKMYVFFSSLVFSISLFAAIPQIRQKDFGSLIKTAKNSALPMTERWQSLIRAGQIAKVEQIVEIKKFATSNEWYMRNASLIALDGFNSTEAIEQAKTLVEDKALVVRSAAVTILTKRNNPEIRKLLTTELAKSYNFSGKQSLWIRPQIMQHMAKTATLRDRQFLARYLFDSDKKVAAYSVDALEKLSSLQFQGSNRIVQWQTHVKKNGWL